MKSILVTGGYGFIGSNFINMLFNSFESMLVTNLDCMTYAADESNIDPTDKNYKHVDIDIRNKEAVDKLFAENEFDIVVHFAAESHVDNSINGPKDFIETNINGTFNLLEAARHAWKSSHGAHKFIMVSTDEVYGSLQLGSDDKFTPTSQYYPHSPYSASKAAADHLAMAYFHTYGFPVIVTNCSNNYGPNQHVEKLIPKIITRALDDLTIPIYGDGLNIRDWLYVGDHCEAIMQAVKYGRVGKKYLIGGNCEKNNIEVTSTIIRMMGSLSNIEFVEDRAGHDRRYAIDASETQSELGWKPSTTFEEGLKKTIEFYKSKREIVEK